MSVKKGNKEISFEDELQKLEALTEQMESNDLPLDKLLTAYEEGTQLAKALMQRAGWQTVSVPVNHRHRTAGVSKYNNLGRALVGIRDLRGVAWLIVRSRRTAVEEV